MTKNLIKQQHYVWREYLRNWSENDKIATYFNKSGKIEITGLNQIAKQRFFYRFNNLSHYEIQFFDTIIESSPVPIRNIQKDLLNDLIKFNQFESVFKTKNNFNSNISKNGFESLHTIFESKGKKIINCQNIDDLKEIVDNEIDKIDALMFLCVQYCRTKKRRDDIKNNAFKNLDILNYDNMFSFLSIIMGTSMGCNLSFDKNISFKLLTIKNELEFITSDQPAVNLLSEIRDENNNVKDLLIYYPLSSKHAIKIEFGNDLEKYSEYFREDKEVMKLNYYLFKKSNLYIFAKNESTLKIMDLETG